jgi:predicted amidohydrolase/ribosomal protein S18 acetylase RimI-like enzyme
MPKTNADRKPKFVVRRWTKKDIPQIIKCHEAAYSDYPEGSHYGKRIHDLQLAAFPEGQFLVETDGKVVAYATSIIVQLEESEYWYSWNEITGSGTFSTHTPSGDTLYGADIAVHPDYRGQRIAGLLYRERKKLLRRYNLRRMMAYGRIPGFKDYAGKITPDEYVTQVERGELKDPALNAHLRAGYRVKRILLDYVWDDASLNYCTILEMENARFRSEKRKIAAAPIRRPVRKIRVCAAQYLMRSIESWEEFQRNVRFFVDSADTYDCHFLLFPELFTAQLFSTFSHEMEDYAAIRKLAGLEDRYKEMFINEATKHGIYIAGGSHPVLRDGKLYNVAHLFTPNGNVYTQDKLHITPTERELWGIQPGNDLKIFETPYGRFAILICYDIEFPELARLLTLAGAEVIFVPFSTDDKKAYYRVRYTAQSRAVENYIYVVLSGNVGNLPQVRSYLLNYGQAAVLTPSDFAFPLQAILGEAEPNAESAVISDIDLTTLAHQRDLGSVRPLYDQRHDLYELRAKEKIRIIRTD